jgi:hypothetical protein
MSKKLIVWALALSLSLGGLGLARQIRAADDTTKAAPVKTEKTEKTEMKTEKKTEKKTEMKTEEGTTKKHHKHHGKKSHKKATTEAAPEAK